MPAKKTPKPAPAAPADDLVVALPPEVLAMMASFEATSEAPAEDEEPLASMGFDTLATDAEAPSEEIAPGEIETLPETMLLPVAAGSQEDEAVLALAPVLDITAASALHEALLARRGAPLALDAGEVKRLGGQCLQLLVSAGKTWTADNQPIRFENASEAFDRDLALLGLRRDQLFQNEAA